MLAKRQIVKYPLTARVKIDLACGDVQAHWHDDCELILIESGSGVVSVGQTQYRADRGDVFLITDRQPHSLLLGGDCTYTSLCFDDGQSTSLLGGKRLGSAKLSRDYNARGTIEEIASELDCRRPFFETVVSASLIRLIAEILREEPLAPKAEFEDVTFGKLLKHIDMNYEFFSFEDAVEFMNLSPVYFSAQFHKYVGTTFSKYLNGVRIEKAVEMLKRPGMKITQVAMSCGFDTIRNFNIVFRKFTGFAPREMPEGYRFVNTLYIARSEEILPEAEMIASK